jgi:threonyl-tRNA synthetase
VQTRTTTPRSARSVCVDVTDRMDGGAPQSLADALNASGFQWKLNPGDGAFYGPKVRSLPRLAHRGTERKSEG